MLCNRLHKFETILSQVMTFEIWNPTFKNIGNRLHAHGNQLLLCKIVIKLFWAFGNRLLPYGNRLEESKNSGKRFFFEKFFGTNCAIKSFLWNLFLIVGNWSRRHWLWFCLVVGLILWKTMLRYDTWYFLALFLLMIVR